MSTISGVNPMSELAKTLAQRLDTNKDGAISTDEFAAFLTNLLGRVKSGTDASPEVPAAATAASATRAAAAVSTARPATLMATSSSRMREGTMLGFDGNKLSDPSHLTFKYQVGRILQFYPSTPEGLQRALAEIQQLVPGAKIVGTHGDKIDFGDYQDPKSGRIGVVDVLVGAASGGRGWAWQPVEE